MMMRNPMYPTANDFMPLSPLLCDQDNATPFLKINNRKTDNKILDNPLNSVPPLESPGGSPISIEGVRQQDEKLGYRSNSSSDNENNTPTGPVISVNKQEVLKLIEEQNLQKQRLLRKAEQARLSRKRKKMRMQELENETDFLRGEVKRLKTALIQKERKIDAMAAAVPSKPVESSDYKEMFSKLQASVNSYDEDAIAKQLSVMVKTLQNTSTNPVNDMETFFARLAPSLPIRFLDWILGRQASFYEDKGGLWNSLFAQEVGISEAQMEKIKKLRSQRIQTAGDKESLIEQLGLHFKQQNEMQNVLMDKISNILGPKQLAKFLLWVHKFGAVCIQIR